MKRRYPGGRRVAVGVFETTLPPGGGVERNCLGLAVAGRQSELDQAEVAGCVLQRRHERPPDTVAREMRDRPRAASPRPTPAPAPGAGAVREADPTHGIALRRVDAGDEEGTSRGVEHGGGQAPTRCRRGARNARRVPPRPEPRPSAGRRRPRARARARCPTGWRRWGDAYPLSFPRQPGRPFPVLSATRSPVFSPVPPDIDFVALEQAELARWSAHRVFERSIEQREGAPPWVFYEGPPTANGMPGLHHAWARVYKDLFCRFRTMDGAYVARRAGWDTHGLPVEVEVEKKLGITGKQQIEDAGRHRRIHPAVPRVGLLVRRRVRPPDDARSATGSTWTRPTGRSARPTSSRSGGTSSSSSTRDCSTRTSRSSPTAHAAARRCRATSSDRPTSTATRRTRPPTSGCGSSTPIPPSSATPSGWRCGPPRRGRCCRTPGSRSTPS